MPPEEIKDNYSATVVAILDKFNSDIEWSLVLAIIEQESHGYRFATRYEETNKYRWFPQQYVSGNNNLTTELNNQKHSWGAMQVMGFTAREYGFRGVSLAELVERYTGIFYGVKYLVSRKKLYPNFPDYVAAFNQGDNRKNTDGTYHNEYYVREVLDKQFIYAHM